MSLGQKASIGSARSKVGALLRRTAGRGRLRLGQRGATMIFVALLIPVVLGFAALAVDLAWVYHVREKLQDIADAACLAGSIDLPNDTTASSTAASYATSNTPSGWGTVLQSADIVPGTWNSTTRTFTSDSSPSSTSNDTALQCTTRRTTANGNATPLFFGPLLGWKTVDVIRMATATYGTSDAWDATIVQDVSQSFMSVAANKTNAQNADTTLLGCQISSTSASSQSGLTAMTGHYTNLEKMTSLSTSANQTTMKNAIKSIAECGTGSMPVCSGSNMAAGLYGAIQNFTPVKQGGTYTPSTNSAGEAVALVTDGAPNANSSVTYTTSDGMPSGYRCSGGVGKSCSDSDLLSWAESQATTLSTMKIKLYIVYYAGDSNDPTGDVANLNAILAKDTYGGALYQTPTSSKLSTVMNDVCSAIPHALVN